MMKLPTGKLWQKGGFTLIELLVVIAIIAIVAAVAFPSLIGKLPSWRLKSASENVGQLFGKARFDAIKNNRPVLVTITNTGGVTSTLELYRDNDRNNVGDVANGDVLIDSLVVTSKYEQAYISSACTKGAVVTDQVVFGSDGTIKGVNGPPTVRGVMPLVLTLTSNATTHPGAYTVVIGRSGIARIETGFTC